MSCKNNIRTDLLDANSNPVVFLDIDGVLNSEIYYESKKFQKEEHSLNQSPETSSRLIYLNNLDPEAIKNLNIIVRDVHNVEFVLSSTWRRSFIPDHMTELMSARGFVGKINTSTPVHNSEYSVRGNEIRHWLGVNRPPDFFNYVILDDDSDMLLHQKNNFMHIDSYTGLTPNQVYRICRFLNKKTNWL